MNFWKEHTGLRALFITGFFFAGLILVIAGWKQTDSCPAWG